MKRVVKYLGIDFGSSKTCVVGFIENEEKPVVFMDEKAGKLSFLSAMREEGGKTYYFEEAVGNGGTTYSGLKEDIAVNERDRETENRARKFLSEIASRIKKIGMGFGGVPTFDFSQLKGICYGHPAYTGKGAVKSYCVKMEKILTELFKPEEATAKDFRVEECAEPVLASCAYHHAHKGQIRAGERILVLDFGGYTMDMTLMEAVAEKDGTVKLVNLKSCVSVNNKKGQEGGVLVGKDITVALCDVIYDSENSDEVRFDYSVEEAKRKFFDKDFSKDRYIDGETNYKKDGQFISYRLRYNATARATETDALAGRMCVGFKGERRANHIALDRKFSQAINMIKMYLKDVGEDMKDQLQISRILFTGGTANIKPLRDFIAEELKEWRAGTDVDFVLWMDDGSVPPSLLNASAGLKATLSSENAVAYGAMLVASGVCQPSKDRATHKAGEDKKKIASLTSENQKLKMQVALEKLKLGKLSEADTKRLPKVMKAVWDDALKGYTEDGRFSKLPEDKKALLLEILREMKIIID